MHNTQPKKADKVLFKYILPISITILVVGVLFIFLVEYWMSKSGNEVISVDYLNHLSNYFAPAGVILSFLTVVLLYANFRHQQEELKKISQQGAISNELIIINNQVEFLTKNLSDKKYSDEKDFYYKVGTVIFDSNILDDKIDTNYSKLNELFISDSENIYHDIALIRSVFTVLRSYIFYSDFSLFLSSRLPVQMGSLYRFLIEFQESGFFKEISNQDYYEILLENCEFIVTELKYKSV